MADDQKDTGLMDQKPFIPGQTNYKGEYRKGHFTRAQIRGKDGSLYMDRWYILYFPRLFSIRIHHIVRPDLDRWPHDHPWTFVSFILRGGYIEEVCRPHQFEIGLTTDGPSWVPYHIRRIRRFNFKTETDLHRITKFSRKQGAWTLVITGPELREWGFMTAEGWVSRRVFGLGGSVGGGSEGGAGFNEFGPEPA